ncbi:MAG: hypothetical protein ABI120_18105, partial [Gemmatimonadaceae bacterium]
WPWAAAAVGVSVGALIFGLAALVSGGLALPIGLHFAWNFFGWAVGEKDTPGLWHVVVSDANTSHLQTIGTASYVVVMLLGCIAFWWYDRQSRILNTNRP